MNTTHRAPRLAIILLDAVVGAYVGAMACRVVVPGLANTTPTEFGAVDAIVILSLAGLCAFMSAINSASVGQLLLTGTLPPKPLAQTLTKHLGWIVLTTSIIGGWIITDISPIEFLSGEGLAGAGRIFKALASPNFDIIGEALQAMVVTIFTAFMATIVAVPVAFLLAFPAARNVMSANARERTVYAVLRALLNIVRSMEPIIWAIIFSVWVGIGPFAGMLALVVHTIASLAKLYSEQIENVSDGPIEAIEATGATRLQVLWFAVVPQCVLPFLSYTIYRWDINVRMATIIGFVGGGGIGTLLTQYQGLSRYQEVGTLVIVITLVVWLLDVASARVREVLK